MKYSIVIPTYNHCNTLLKPCLESIFKYTDMADVELVISANGCTDNTQDYLNNLQRNFTELGFEQHLKVVYSEQPLGFAKAINLGIMATTTEKIVLLNNDIILLEQFKNQWLDMLNAPFNQDTNCGISCPIIQYSPEANHNFAVFFCVMVDKRVFNTIGLLNEEYGIGSGEDVEFCIEALKAGFNILECVPKQYLNDVMYTGSFPIYHKGEQTVLDSSLVSDYKSVYYQNGLKLARKYNIEHYRKLLNNNYERHLSINGEQVPPREQARYLWASSSTIGAKVLELGCSNGYGSQYFKNVEYTGIDYDPQIIECAKQENWGTNKQFIHGDINTLELEYYDTIVAMEVIEHLDNGLEIVEKLKKYCKRLLVTVPYKEPPGLWGEHHKLHWLEESHLPGFTYKFCDEFGNIHDSPHGEINLMLCQYDH